MDLQLPDRAGRAREYSGDWSLELIAAAVLFLLIAPILTLIAALIVLDNQGPPLFRHRRIGRGGREFPCFKFRTMRVDADAVLAEHLQSDPETAREWHEQRKLKNDPRVTRVGKLLRATSLDELPQLLNIVRGEMAFVGPRPIVQSEIPKYGPYYRDYCSVRPGLTGLWQVSGRSDTSYDERVRLDVEYVRSRSLGLNLRIIILTLPAVLLRKGSY